MNKKVPVEVSARHIHLSQEDVEILFGSGHQLKEVRKLMEAPDFASEETVSIQANGREIPKVRVVGPIRLGTQIELSLTDVINLGIAVDSENLGRLKGTEEISLVGPKGTVAVRDIVIIASRHLHCTAAEAKSLKLKDGDHISVLVKGPRAVTFHNIKVRVRDGFQLCLQLDTDEGNAAGINRQAEGEICKS